MTQPRISVVVPVYNAQPFLPALLSSLLGQTERNIEIIAIDDGSSDDSLSILTAAAAADPRVRVYHQAHRGASAARNMGIGRARGRWIAFADADDWLARPALETWADQAERVNVDLLVCNGFRFSDVPDSGRRRAILKCQPWHEVLTGAEWIVRAVAAREWPHYAWLQMVSREFLVRSRAEFPEGMVHEDILWTLQVGREAQCVAFAPAPLYGYRINPASTSRVASETALEHRARMYMIVLQRLAEAAEGERRCNPELRQALLRHLNREAGHFLGLLRKRLRRPDIRRVLAHEFFRLRLTRAMFEGAVDGHDWWRAVRAWFVLKRVEAGAAPHPNAVREATMLARKVGLT